MSEEIIFKACKKCGKEKILDDFPTYDYKKKDGSKIKGYEGKCKECKKDHVKNSYIKNKDYFREYREKNSEKISQYKKDWRIINKEYVAEEKRNYSKKNSEKLKVYKKGWYIKNKEKILELSKNYYIENIEKIKKSGKNRYIKNFVKISEYHRVRGKEIRDKLMDPYIIVKLSEKTGKNAKFIRQYPDLIEAQRLMIKMHRLCKTSQS
jgi:hypothetical protein